MPAFFATCLRGLEGPLTAELKTFGVEKADAARAGVAFEGSWESALRACLWSRLASRILLPLAESEIRDAQALYNVAREFPWEQHLDLNQTFRIEAHGTSPGINHTGFAALKVKDAVADRFRSRLGRRPSVDADNPDTRIHVLLRDNYVKFSLDLSGESLHRRGYRTRAGEAPLGETLAAGVLWLAGWPEMAKAGAPFVDPCCGSGTLVIEAALWAADVAPGLAAGRAFGAERWPGLDRALWGKLQAEAAQRRAAGLETLKAGRFLGCDKDTSLLRATRTNADAAGLGSYLRFERREFSEWLPSHVPEGPGLIAANPPYGERMGQEAEATALYVEIGNLLRRCFGGWEAAILASNSGLNHRLGLRARKVQALKNGPLDVQLAVLSIPKAVEGQPVEAPRLSETATAFRNRLIKMHKHLGKWAKREGIEAYRVYDADLPDFNAAIDFYRDHLVIQEYQAPPEVPVAKAEQRLQEILLIAPEVLEIPRDQVILKVREKAKGGAKYQKAERPTGRFMVVSEYGLKFRVNLQDYIDTGLFLDHRALRHRMGQEAAGKDFLNLFGYTGAATVHAAAGGASSTTTVDLSSTYLDWAGENLALNGFSGDKHQLIQADCLAWLRDQQSPGARRYGLIFVDPPTFSNSKRMEDDLDLQRDHVELLRLTSTLLAPGGVLYFSTNARRFKLDEGALKPLGLEWREISKATLPKDFEGNPRIRRVWRASRP